MWYPNPTPSIIEVCITINLFAQNIEAEYIFNLKDNHQVYIFIFQSIYKTDCERLYCKDIIG